MADAADAVKIAPHAEEFDQFRRVASVASGQHTYDFLGTATRTAFKVGSEKFAAARGTETKPGPPPRNEHYLDWVALLQAVLRAKGTFRMAELGAAWGPWLVRGAFAARQRGITKIELIGVEADPAHHAWMREHFIDNGLNPEAHSLLHGAVVGKDGPISFPKIENPDVEYGAGIMSKMENMITVPGYSIAGLLDRFSGPVDFVHVDIQSAEYDAIPPAMDALLAKVRLITVGTHQSDAKHDALVAQFRDAGWIERMNYPRARENQTPWGPIKTGDGFLLFDNPRELTS